MKNIVLSQSIAMSLAFVALTSVFFMISDNNIMLLVALALALAGALAFAGAVAVAGMIAIIVTEDGKLSFWKIFSFIVVKSLLLGTGFYLIVIGKETGGSFIALSTIILSTGLAITETVLQHLGEFSLFAKSAGKAVEKAEVPASA